MRDQRGEKSINNMRARKRESNRKTDKEKASTRPHRVAMCIQPPLYVSCVSTTWHRALCVCVRDDPTINRLYNHSNPLVSSRPLSRPRHPSHRPRSHRQPPSRVVSRWRRSTASFCLTQGLPRGVRRDGWRGGRSLGERGMQKEEMLGNRRL